MARFNNLVALVATLLSAQAVLAHFQLTYPETRGFNEDQEPTAPCGGFDTVGSRTQFPLKDGFVEINSGHTSYSYVVNVLVNNNPTASDFSSNSTVQVASGSRDYPQAACLSLNLTNSPDIKAGANATIQIIYNGGDGQLYQCTDVVFSDSPSGWNNSVCVNADGSSTSSTASSSAAASPSNTQAASKATSLTVTGGLMALVAACVSYVIA
ncbi:MAG: hypothetical protein EXX96DRAFT_653703 [Benjaminiella poitrasii]|nr:MAG: hypothetical protein EXX96DRAFT_653703 [Benjaminiella poitrasii]